MEIKFPTFDGFRKTIAERGLPKAIENRDMDAIRNYLSKGAKRIDYKLMGDGERHGERTFSQVFNDPAEMALHFRFNESEMEPFVEAGLISKQKVDDVLSTRRRMDRSGPSLS